jgi:type III secretion protein N (ATPase)
VFLDMGEYSPGVDAANDRALQRRDALGQWLRQSTEQRSEPDETQRSLHEIIA